MRGYRYEVRMTSYVGFLGQDGFIDELACGDFGALAG